MGHFIFSFMHIFIVITAFLDSFTINYSFSILWLLFFTISAHAIYSPIQAIYNHLTGNKKANSPEEMKKTLILAIIVFALIGTFIFFTFLSLR